MLGFGWKKEALRRRFYPDDFPGMYDRLAALLREHAREGQLMLDAGCGSGRVFRYELPRRPRLIVGVDLTEEPRGNPNIDAAARADLARLPFRDATFDLVVSSHVAEHLTAPGAVFRELARVMKPGAALLLLTPNRWHYVTLAARLLPHRFHVAFNRWRGVDARDIFPTVYRANTAGRLRRLLESAGLRVERLEQFETEPEYLAFHPVTYALGVAYERVVNRIGALRGLRVNLMVVARKPALDDRGG
ncbi:MAG TPA: methyltransferase domain-containing protein [Dehalococcoidia bacterium]|nr:methyltransferase domain-containing protein [Dehalococcoidia bacterium]